MVHTVMLGSIASENQIKVDRPLHAKKPIALKRGAQGKTIALDYEL